MRNFITLIDWALKLFNNNDEMLKQKESYIQSHNEKNIEYETKGIPKMPYPNVWWNPYKKQISDNIPDSPKPNTSKIYK